MTHCATAASEDRGWHTTCGDFLDPKKFFSYTHCLGFDGKKGLRGGRATRSKKGQERNPLLTYRQVFLTGYDTDFNPDKRFVLSVYTATKPMVVRDTFLKQRWFIPVTMPGFYPRRWHFVGGRVLTLTCPYGLTPKRGTRVLTPTTFVQRD
jgi:hypothetical protein